jgi:hypothetical protein
VDWQLLVSEDRKLYEVLNVPKLQQQSHLQAAESIHPSIHACTKQRTNPLRICDSQVFLHIGEKKNFKHKINQMLQKNLAR